MKGMSENCAKLQRHLVQAFVRCMLSRRTSTFSSPRALYLASSKTYCCKKL